MHALCQKISLALTFVPSQERLTVKLSSAFEYSDESVPTGRIHIFWIPLLQTPEPNKESWCVYYMQGKEDDPCFVFLVFFLHIRQGFDPVSADSPCMLRFVQRCRSHWHGWVLDQGSKTNFAHARSQRGRNGQMYRKVRPQKTPRTPTRGDESCVCSCLHWCIYLWSYLNFIASPSIWCILFTVCTYAGAKHRRWGGESVVLYGERRSDEGPCCALVSRVIVQVCMYKYTCIYVKIWFWHSSWSQATPFPGMGFNGWFD